jgi:hypothetical protein
MTIDKAVNVACKTMRVLQVKADSVLKVIKLNRFELKESSIFC